MTSPSILTNLPIEDTYKKALALGGDGVVNTIKESGLRGRGGAGFPTGIKWDAIRRAKRKRYIVCNADEGEPGTFKDRKLLIEHTDEVLLGMAIAGATLATNKGIVYLRWEYSDIKAAIEESINKLAKPLNMGFEIRMGAGAYVCGEETALIRSMEGKRGEARNRLPYPVESGYLAAPTLVNNVETFCCVAHIIANGAKWFSAVGTEKSKGPKLFTVSGHVAKPGVYEFPLGVTLKEVLAKAGSNDTKAVQVGGASGVCIVPADFSRKLAYEDLPPGGSIIVMDQSVKMIDVLENIMDFFNEESCGQCTPCREGNCRLLKFVTKMKEKGVVMQSEWDRYIELSQVMQDASKCGLGQMSARPYLSIIKQFQSELVDIKPDESDISKAHKY